MISGVVLAAGTSSRLGRPKQLLDLAGRTVLLRVVDAALGAALDEVVVVLGHEADQIRTTLPRSDRVRVAVNPDYLEGQATSLREGLRTASERSEAAVILLGDQPAIRTDAVDAIAEAWRGGAGPLVQASYQGHPAHPTLLARAVWPELAALAGDEGARGFIAANRSRRTLVEVGGSPPDDIDTEEDYRRALSKQQWTGMDKPDSCDKSAR
jgi:molybdenum cofactor cytidylyltransferase